MVRKGAEKVTMGNLFRISEDVNEDVEWSVLGTDEGRRLQRRTSSISECIERSALGTDEGRRLRRRTSSKVAQDILNRAAELERATQHQRVTTSPAQGTGTASARELAEGPDPVTAADFSVFYRQSVPRLVAFLRWQGASILDAADCVQEAMTQAYRQWSTICHPHAWCRRVVSRLYVQRIASVVEPVADPGAAGLLFARDTDGDGFKERHRVSPLLEQLPVRQRQVMAWAYDGGTPVEIAEVLKITPEAVREGLNNISATLEDVAR
jgi:DNA-directed RNA polymerase specialized sigma24 family protein